MKREQQKPTRAEAAQVLTEALMPFCDTATDLRPELATPFRQKDSGGQEWIIASDGRALIRIHAKRAGVAVGPFQKREKPCVERVMPTVGFDDVLKARYVSRQALADTIQRMKDHEAREQQLAAADMLGSLLSMDNLSRAEVALRILGADGALLVWAKEGKVVLRVENTAGEIAAEILLMCFEPREAQAFIVANERMDDGDALQQAERERSVRIDWQRGLATWASIKADLAAQEEALRMARREVYMVDVVKRAYIPVYARSADEARRILDSHWIDPERDWDSEWELGDYTPEAEDLDDIEDRYHTIVTADGSKSPDEIRQIDRLSQEWEEKQNNNNN